MSETTIIRTIEEDGGSHNSTSKNWLNYSAKLWFAVTVMGQWIFAASMGMWLPLI